MKKIIIIGIILVVAAGLVYRKYFKTPTVAVTNFEECAAQGYPILETYPRQCKTPRGQTFTEDIGNALEKQNLIKVSTPQPNEFIKSPLKITGEARGFWFFEAVFPVRLLDENGNIIAQQPAQAQEEWMTEDFVPFEAELNFVVSEPQKGTLILDKDNPSDLPQNADELRIPIKLQETGNAIKLYYYNPELDKDASGNITCSRQGLVPVDRKIPVSQTPIQDAIKLLLLGELTNEERALGITTEYPLSGLSLKGASLKDGTLTLEFDDPNNKTGGGSCRIGILWFQIEATAKQFTGVQFVRFMPEELFQP